MDVYSRSSGAAWSMAARRYFRKGDADLPSRGAFVYRGTQVVTGAEARQVKEDEARRRSAADELLRPRPGTKAAPRQAFDHAPKSHDRSTPRSEPRPAQAPPQSQATPHPEHGDARNRSSATMPAAESSAGPRAGTAKGRVAAAPRNTSAADQPRAASAARTAAASFRQASATSRTSKPDPNDEAGSRDASMGASAIIGAVAALLVTTPIVLLSGVVLLHPIDPIVVAIIVVVAALSGGIAAAAWDAGRHRNPPG